ncbi:MAG TPA: peptidoglycan bridge formation glycyltransferase FemA/FemB family protein [Syntrophomonadaceae bacterium]|nr:peptidoglycan bridge formation glycyltransferase FemA/FemB family protein [Syntrophomonadaceae bacterium]
MYQAHLVDEKDRELFNEFIGSSPKPHFLQTYEWGELKEATGWEPLRLLVTKDGLPIAAISILKRRLPVFNRSIFYAPRGPVIGEGCDPAGEDFFWQEVKRLGRSHRAIFLKIDPDVPEEDTAYKKKLESRGFRPGSGKDGFGGVQPRFVFRLDITPSEEELLAAMEGKTRYNIRLAERKGVTIRAAESRRDLEIFYEILKETAARDGFLIRSFGYFEKMWDLFVTRGRARIFLAEYRGEAIAGTLAFHCGHLVWYLYGASSNRWRNVMPNNLLQWTMIRWARSLGCTVYDFRGVPGTDDPNHPLHGLYRFKKGFGAKFTEFVGEYDLVFSPFWYFLWRRLLPVYLRITHRRAARQEDKGTVLLSE